MADTTAENGNIDAVAASLIEGGPVEDETTTEDAAQSEPDDAQAAAEVDDDAADAEQADDGEDDGADESDTDAEDNDPTEQLFTVKVDGRDQQVPLTELLRGYSGQAYIQQRMREVASVKTEAETVYAALQSERQQLTQLVQAAQSGQIPLRAPTPPDAALLQRDPIGYLEARVKYDDDVAAYQQTQSAVQELEARQAAAQEQARVAYLRDQHAQLSQVIPAFAKPETAAKVRQELISTGTDVYGYTPEELSGITDHRALRVLHDAAQYRRLMSGKARVEKQAEQQQKTPTLKPGAKVAAKAQGRVQADKARVQMKRTGSVDDVARFLLM